MQEAKIIFWQLNIVNSLYPLFWFLSVLFLHFSVDVNSSGWFQQQQGASQKPANDDLCSLSLGFYRSNLLDCSLQLGRLNQDQNPNIAGVSTSLSLCLPENFHGRHAGTASTSQIFFSVDNDLRAEFARQEEDMTRFIQQKVLWIQDAYAVGCIAQVQYIIGVWLLLDQCWFHSTRLIDPNFLAVHTLTKLKNIVLQSGL